MLKLLLTEEINIYRLASHNESESIKSKLAESIEKNQKTFHLLNKIWNHLIVQLQSNGQITGQNETYEDVCQGFFER